MARQIAFTRNPLASTQLDKSAQISEKVRSVFERDGSAQVHKQSTIKLEWLRPSPTQPRKTFDEQALEDLKNSIAEHGVLEPLIVRLQGDHYEIICGERRFRAAGALGLKEVPITVLDLTDEEAYAVSLHENIHRDNLTPVDEATCASGFGQSVRIPAMSITDSGLKPIIDSGPSRSLQRVGPRAIVSLLG